jgi:hypothetical protein
VAFKIFGVDIGKDKERKTEKGKEELFKLRN